jgi:two-component sensor histidine kinase
MITYFCLPHTIENVIIIAITRQNETKTRILLLLVSSMCHLQRTRKERATAKEHQRKSQKRVEQLTVSDFMLYCLLDPSSNEMMQGAYPACFLRELRTDF